jgi:hypothetical protein
MSEQQPFHMVTVGMSPRLVNNLWDRIASRGGFRISHVAHASFDRNSWGGDSTGGSVYFIREQISEALPQPDPELLASLEQEGVPTIHNMLMSDRFLCPLPYEQGLAYATLLVRRLLALYRETKPSVIVGDFDNLLGSLGFAVAKRLSIPWCAMYFSPLPSGRVAFCSDLSPASMIKLDARRAELSADAERVLRDFEARKVQAYASVPPQLLSASFVFKQLPSQLRTLLQILGRRRLRQQLKYTDYAGSYSVAAKFREALRARRNLWRMHRSGLATAPGRRRYAFFGLHMQPESSIDVHAHFFSNQLRVVELMARSLPPTHTLFVKLHKSDASNYSPQKLAQLSSFPGVQLVSPYADAIEFIRHADLVFAIQGTIGLEAAMLGKRVVMFGDSPVKNFPSVSTIGKVEDLPQLVREKLAERSPSREEILAGLATYFEPFHHASCNDWTVVPSDAQIDDYVQLFALLERYVRRNENAGRDHRMAS